MRRLLFLSMFIFAAFMVEAQTITITSFAKAESELEITVRKKHYPGNEPFTDGNGDPCALIRISYADNMPTEMFKRLGATVPGQVLHRKYVENEGLYFYVSYTADQLTVFDTQNKTQHRSLIYNLKKHFKYNDNTGEHGLDPNAVYEMTLKFAGDDEEMVFNYLIINATPADASIYIDGEYVGEGEVSKLVSVGNHSYKVERKLYHSVENTVLVTDDKKELLEVTLLPAFGYISVNSTPDGAAVFVDGEKVGETPYRSQQKYSIGEHIVKLMKDSYSTVEEKVTVEEGKTSEVMINMSFKVADTDMLDSDDNSIYGKLDINTSPMGADIILDGKKIGTTPEIFHNIIAGDYMLRLQKAGCAPVEKKITIEKGKLLVVNEKLETGKTVTIHSTPQGADVYFDEKLIGTTPCKYAMPIGKHNLTVRNGKKIATKDIDFTLDGESDIYFNKLRRIEETFVTLNAAYTNTPYLSFGLTFGQMRKVGWFVSVMSGTGFKGFSAERTCDEWGFVDGIYPFYSGNRSSTRLSAMLGGILNIGDVVGLRLAAGYGMSGMCYETAGGEWVKHEKFNDKGIDASVGVQFNIKGFLLSLDAVTTNFSTLEGKIGMGYCF